jgi:hypothetical protein
MAQASVLADDLSPARRRRCVSLGVLVGRESAQVPGER